MHVLQGAAGHGQAGDTIGQGQGVAQGAWHGKGQAGDTIGQGHGFAHGHGIAQGAA